MTDEFGDEIEADEFLREVYDGVQGFAWLDSLAGDPRAYYLPDYLTDMVDDAYFSGKGNLYFSTFTFTDGRTEAYTDEATGKRKITTGRQKANAKEGRVIFCDADSAHPDVFRLKPSIILESSPGRYQTFWILDEVYPAARIALVARQVAYAHVSQGADISSSSLTKLLRVPGSTNSKRNRETGEYVHPDQPIVRAWDTGERYTLAEIESKYEDIEFVRNLLPETEEVELPDAEHLAKFTELYDALPERSMTGVDLVSMIDNAGWLDEEGKPREGSSGDRSRWRYKLICELMREGYENSQVLVLVWASRSGEKWRADPRGQRGLWSEILKARIEINGEQGELDALESDSAYQESVIGTPLLNDAERALIKDDPHFINRYLAWVRARLSRANFPYHRLNAWQVLSVAYAELTQIPDEARDRPLNFFTLELGETATGKSDASEMMFTMMHHVHPDQFWGDTGVNIGGDATPTALKKSLVDRDAKVSLFQSDEAHGPLGQIQKQEYQTGSLELYTYLYDGRVPKIQRMTASEASGKDATTIFGMWFLGPPKQVTEVIPRSWFESGFMGRFMCAIGDPPDVNADNMKMRRRKGDLSAKRVDPFVLQIANEVEHNKEVFYDRGMPYLEETEASLERMAEAHRKMIDFAKAHPKLSGPLYEATRRQGLHIRKAAWLLALSEGSAYVTERHALIAIEAAEGWLAALVEIAGMVSTGDYAKQANAIERAIRDNQGWMSKAKIWRKFEDLEARVKAGFIEELIAQGRIKTDVRDGVQGYRVRE